MIPTAAGIRSALTSNGSRANNIRGPADEADGSPTASFADKLREHTGACCQAGIQGTGKQVAAEMADDVDSSDAVDVRAAFMSDSVGAFAGVTKAGITKDAGLARVTSDDEGTPTQTSASATPIIEVWLQPQLVASGAANRAAETTQLSSDDTEQNAVQALAGQVVAVVPGSGLQLVMTEQKSSDVFPELGDMMSRSASRPAAQLRAPLPMPLSPDTAVADFQTPLTSSVAGTQSDATALAGAATPVSDPLQSGTAPPRAESGSDVFVSQAVPAGQQPAALPAPAPLPEAAGVRPSGGNAPLMGANKPQGLAQVLGDRLRVQLGSGIEHATIRLDPPMKGSIEIIVHREDGAVQIHLRASDSEVARQLQSIGDTLKQDLIQRQHGGVSVQVWDGSRDADGRQRQRQSPTSQEPGRALNDGGDAAESARFSLAQSRSELT
jgi:flagellar hook-length control protein FliK